MTDILKVVTEFCDQYIDDVRLEDTKKSNFPLWAWKMWGYLNAGLPFFSRPATIKEYICGTEAKPNIVAPKFTSYSKIFENDVITDMLIVDESLKGFEIISAREVEEDGYGDVIYSPVSVSYDSESGTITVHGSIENPIKRGTEYEFDLYKDGYFRNEISGEIGSIIGLCFAYAWQMKFNNDWLSNVSKTEDASFKEQNRANKENADTERLKAIKKELDSAMKRYEENIEIRSFVSSPFGARAKYI